ncbi:MAG: hypothetical protein NT138_05630 [Planctomycetales bacterium]|nr:hypothetical protein [Planctomycetales bacterium]
MAGDQVWHEDVSDVPCDSIRGVVSSLSILLQGNSEATVEWSLEPGYAKWILLRNGTTLEFVIMHSERSDRQLVYCGKFREIVHRFIKALCDLAAEQFGSDENLPTAVWSWPFPKQELKQLRALFATTLKEPAERGD